MLASNQIMFFFSVLGAFNGLLLSLYFTINAKKKIANYFLALLLLVLSIRISKSVFFYFNPHLANIFIQIGLSACVLIGPLLFLYLKSYRENKNLKWIKHVLPYLIVLSFLGFLYPYVEHRSVWSRWIVKAIYFQWLLYIVFSFKYVQPIIQKIKNKERLVKGDIWIASIYFGVAFIWLAYSIGAYTSYIVGSLSFTFVFYLIVLCLVHKYSNDSNALEKENKYKNKEIDKDTQGVIEQKLLIIKEKELYLNPNFSLTDAAKELRLTKHVLSQYINEKLDKSFPALMNEYRIEKAKRLLESKSNYTIESLGYDSGFSSKSTFFTAFKKATGMTPTEYQKTLSK